MAVINPSTPFDSLKRKFSKSDQIYFKNRSADNATIGVRMKHPSTSNSTSQQAYRTAFAAATAQVKTIMADAEQRAPYEAQFRNQKKYMYLRNYIFAQVFVKPE